MAKRNRKSNGNVIELLDSSIEKVNSMLNTAWDALTQEERDILEDAMQDVAKAKQQLVGMKRGLMEIIDTCAPDKENTEDDRNKD